MVGAKWQEQRNQRQWWECRKSDLSLCNNVLFLFCFCHTLLYRNLVPQARIEPMPLTMKAWVLTTGPPEFPVWNCLWNTPVQASLILSPVALPSLHFLPLLPWNQAGKADNPLYTGIGRLGERNWEGPCQCCGEVKQKLRTRQRCPWDVQSTGTPEAAREQIWSLCGSQGGLALLSLRVWGCHLWDNW